MQGMVKCGSSEVRGVGGVRGEWVTGVVVELCPTEWQQQLGTS